jgi:hypothetical protein
MLLFCSHSRKEGTKIKGERERETETGKETETETGRETERERERGMYRRYH